MVLSGAPEPVLRREQPHEPRAPQITEQRGRVSMAGVDRGLVREERDTTASEERATVVDEDFEAGSDPGHPAR